MEKTPLDYSYRSILQVALPIMVGTFVQFLVNFTDTAFVGRLGENELNAAGNAGLIYLTMYVIGQGFSTAIQVLVARRNGQQKRVQAGLIFDHGFICLFITAFLLFAAVGYFSFFHLDLVVRDPVLISGMQDFLQYRIWGYFFSVTQLAVIAFYMGIARTRIIIHSTILVSVLNVFLAYAMIYGEFGFPQMGIRGAALASTISEMFTFLWVMVYVIVDRDVRSYRLLRFKKISRTLFVKITTIAAPLVVQRFISLFAWTAFFLLIEKTGSHNLAVSQIIRSLYFLAFIPILGFGAATGTFVSHYMATYDIRAVIRIMKRISLVSMIFTFVFVHGYLFYPRPVISLMTIEPDLISDTIPVLRLIITSMLLHSGVMVLFSAVSGVGDTRAALLIEFSAIVIYLIYAWYVCVVNPQPLMIIWTAEFVYFGLLALFSLAYFRWSAWKSYTI